MPPPFPLLFALGAMFVKSNDETRVTENEASHGVIERDSRDNSYPCHMSPNSIRDFYDLSTRGSSWRMSEHIKNPRRRSRRRRCDGHSCFEASDKSLGPCPVSQEPNTSVCSSQFDLKSSSLKFLEPFTSPIVQLSRMTNRQVRPLIKAKLLSNENNRLEYRVIQKLRR